MSEIGEIVQISLSNQRTTKICDGRSRHACTRRDTSTIRSGSFNLLDTVTSLSRSVIQSQSRTSINSLPFMASLLILRRPLLAPFSLGLGITTAFAAHSIYKPRPLLCDASPAARNISDALHTYSHEAKVPVFRNGRPNPAAYKQLSAGSICGKCPPPGLHRSEGTFLGVVAEHES